MEFLATEIMYLCVCVADLKQMHLLNAAAAQIPERPGNMLAHMI